MAGVWGEEVARLVVGVTPDENVAQGVAAEDGSEGGGPPVVGLDAFETGLGQCRGLVMLLGNCTDGGQVAVEVGSIVGYIALLTIAVDAHEVDDVVARVSF